MSMLSSLQHELLEQRMLARSTSMYSPQLLPYLVSTQLRTRGLELSLVVGTRILNLQDFWWQAPYISQGSSAYHLYQ